MIPHMLKLAKKQSFPEDFPKPRKFRETSRNDWIFKFRVQNQVSWQKVSRKNTQYIEISQNQPNLGHFGVLGFWDSKVQKIKEVTKSTQNYPIYVTGIISAKNYQKTTLFAIVAILLCKSSNKKKTMLMLWIFLTKKIFLAERESFNPNQAVLGRIPPQAHLMACHFKPRSVMSVKIQCNFLFCCLKQVRIKNLGGFI